MAHTITGIQPKLWPKTRLGPLVCSKQVLLFFGVRTLRYGFGIEPAPTQNCLLTHHFYGIEPEPQPSYFPGVNLFGEICQFGECPFPTGINNYIYSPEKIVLYVCK